MPLQLDAFSIAEWSSFAHFDFIIDGIQCRGCHSADNSAWLVNAQKDRVTPLSVPAGLQCCGS
jgi:hypothetical protein